MSLITRQDKNGVKPLLQTGEFGYDNYPAGGDNGRVYVGTGSENIPLAKQAEMSAVDGKADVHIARVDNPHGVTKAQVGLGNADNTGDNVKNVLSATKWTTARTITLSGDVTGSVSVDGSANVTITTTVQPNSVALGTDTTGDYMADIIAGSGISVSHTPSEGSTATITNSAPNVTTNITTTHNSANVIVNSSDGTDGTINSATQTLAGVMSAADKTKLDGIEAGATGDQTAAEIKTAYESNNNTNALTDSLLTLLTTKKVKNVSTDALNDKLVITYTDDTVSNLNINDVITDIHVSGASLDATSNVLTLTSADGGADVTVNLSDFVNSSELTTALNTTVKLTGNQTIAGVKTFSSSPIVPTPTTDFQSVPLKSTNITVDVGVGQTYTTINQALEYLSGFYPMYKKGGITATINLKAGFVMAEQVLVSGIDLGWVTIVGEDAKTIITHTAFTTDFNGTNYPAFGVDKGGTSPVIGQLFRFNVEKVGGNKHGLMALGAGSSANVLSGKGFIGAGEIGIYATGGSTINANSANCSNAGTYGIYATGGSTINAESINCSNAGTYGIFAVRGSTINANSANCSNAGTYGIYATWGSTINANSANCSNTGNAGIFASYSSTINASSAIIQNQTTGTARVRVLEGSNIEASDINTSGGTVSAFNQAVNTLTANGIIYQ